MDGSKVSTVLVGAITVALGGFFILAGLGVVPAGRDDPTMPVADQRAVAMCIGVVFAAGGAAATLSAFPGRGVRIAFNLLGLIILVGLTSLFAWIAVGAGARGFSSPLAVLGPVVNEVVGRVLFGFAALMGLLMSVLMVRSFARAPRSVEG